MELTAFGYNGRMVRHLSPCPSCRRHVRVTETECPFCSVALDLSHVPPPVLPPRRLGRAAQLAFSASLVGTLAGACDGDSTVVRDDVPAAGEGGNAGTGGKSATGGAGGRGASGGAAGRAGASGAAGRGTAGTGGDRGGRGGGSGGFEDVGGYGPEYGGAPADAGDGGDDNFGGFGPEYGGAPG